MVSDDYLCGLFDGEGAVSVSLTKKGFVALTVVKHNHPVRGHKVERVA